MRITSILSALFLLTAAASAQVPFSLQAVPGELLSERDPVYIPEFPVAYNSVTLLVRFVLQQEGAYLVSAEFSGQEKDAPDNTHSHFYFQERVEGAGAKEIKLEAPVTALQKQQGLLWSWIPERRTNVRLSVVRQLSRAEAIQSVSSEELQKLRTGMESRYGRDIAEKYMEELLPPQSGIQRPYLAGEFEIPYAPVMRTMAKTAPRTR